MCLWNIAEETDGRGKLAAGLMCETGTQDALVITSQGDEENVGRPSELGVGENCWFEDVGLRGEMALILNSFSLTEPGCQGRC